MFSILRSKQLFFQSLVCFATTVAFWANLTTSTIANNSHKEDVHKLKQEVSSEDEKNVVQSGNVSFNLQKCQRIGQSKTVNCQFLFTATSERGQRISIYGGNKYGGSRVFDLSGNEYVATFAQIGRVQSRDSYNGEVVNELIPGIPTKAIINFDLPTDITQLAALEITYNDTGKAVFRNIDIVRTNNTVKPQSPRSRKK